MTCILLIRQSENPYWETLAFPPDIPHCSFQWDLKICRPTTPLTFHWPDALLCTCSVLLTAEFKEIVFKTLLGIAFEHKE